MIPVMTTSNIGKIRANSTIGPADSPPRNLNKTPVLVRGKQRISAWNGEEYIMELAPRSECPERDSNGVRYALTTIHWMQLQQPGRTERMAKGHRSARDSPVPYDPHETKYTTSDGSP
jgi:hypothetical protein